MHVFIDTNILLNFYHYSKDELDALNDVFGSHEHGSATVHLTEQVRNEFKRNREVKIMDALRKFEATKFAPQFPYFLKGYEEYVGIRQLSAELEKLRKSILAKVGKDIAEQRLIADKLINDIFEASEVVPLSNTLYRAASMRMELGNPPGKNKSLGDAINWLTLRDAVPDGEDVHIVSEDGDFYSVIDDKRPHPFLLEEWRKDKKGELFVYRTLSGFMSEHFDGVAFSFDKDKDALIESLTDAGSFAVTHSLIAKLENYAYFSLKEVHRILDAAEENSQFGWIVTDHDVSDFLNRVAVPHLSNIKSDEHKKILQEVIEEQRERGRED